MSRRVILGVVAISALLATPIWLNSTAGGASPGQSAGPPVVLSEAHHDVSPPLRSIPEAAPLPRSGDEVENEIPRVVRVPGGPDGALQHSLNAPVPGMPSPINNFAGAQNTDNASLVFPPDTEGDVGPNNYVQVVNLTFTIFNKAGVKLVGPSPTNTIWSGFGGLCQTHNDGDGVVLYDPLADRWLISQFAITSTASHQCIAISQTGDPTGAWFRYDFPYSTTLLNDYPKFGVWPDAYYMSANQFTLAGSTFSGAGVVAYERARMLQGLSARAVYIDLGANSSTSTFSGLLPADVDGTTPPPAGAPNHYLTIQGTTLGDPADRLQQWDFHVDWTTPANSSFTQAAVLPVAAFNGNMCNFARNCIGQLGTTAKLDAISDRLMFRNAYRNFGTYEAEVVDHTVNVGSNRGAIRWYEVRNASTSPRCSSRGPTRRYRQYGKPLDGVGARSTRTATSPWGTPTPRPACTRRSATSATRRRPARNAAAGRGDADHRRRRADGDRQPLGRLQHARGRPDRRLHVLVHAGVLRGRRERTGRPGSARSSSRLAEAARPRRR